MNTTHELHQAAAPHGETPEKKVQQQSVFEQLRLAWSATKERKQLIGWYLLMYAGLIIAISGAFFVIYVLAGKGVSPWLLLAVGMACLAAWVLAIITASLALLYAVTRDEADNVYGYWHACKVAWKNIWPLLWISVLGSTLLVPGYMLFLIPGIVLTVYLVLAQFAYVKEGMRGFAALARSIQMVYGAWWVTLGRLAIVMLISVLVSIVISVFDSMEGLGELLGGVISFLVQGVLAVFMIHFLYQWYQIRAAAVPIDSVEIARIRKWLLAGFWAALALTIVLPMIALSLAYIYFKDDIIRWYLLQQLESEIQMQFDETTIPEFNYSDVEG